MIINVIDFIMDHYQTTGLAVLADEQTSNHDSDNAQIIIKLFKDMSTIVTALIFSTHEMEYLEYPDREIVLNQGRVKQNKM